MVPGTLNVHVFQAHPVMLEELNTRIQEATATISQEHLKKAMFNLLSQVNIHTACEECHLKTLFSKSRIFVYLY
jgi:hypothetical protein